MDLIPRLDPDARRIISDFIIDRMAASGNGKAFIGLSGGLDSALVLRLLTDTLGPERVRPMFLPCGALNQSDLGFAEMASRSCGTHLKVLDIEGIVNAIPLDLAGMVKGNAMARARMLVLYALANAEGGLVIGTSNKSELLTGYFTKYGDGASDICPIGDLFKTQVRELARVVGVPMPIIERPPTAGLVSGQTDEGELRLPYPLLDQVLNGSIRGYSVGSISDSMDHTTTSVEEFDRSGFEPPVREEDVLRVRSMMRASRHKRLSLQVPKLGPYTIGVDHRERL
jgi:NAD+ synthase